MYIINTVFSMAQHAFVCDFVSFCKLYMDDNTSCIWMIMYIFNRVFMFHSGDSTLSSK